MYNLSYSPLEKITIDKPVNRIGFIKAKCKGKTVLDLGCYDETALNKQSSGYWLFEEISKVADTLIGIDNSEKIPENGIILSEQAKILRGDIEDFNFKIISKYSFDIIIAGELIEHLTNTLSFFNKISIGFPGKKLICTTPNSTSVSNIILSLFKRESTHIDHKQIYSFKTLNTLCGIAGFRDWKIIPYYVKYTEMILKSGHVKKYFVKCSESCINTIEYLFPLQSGGFILEIDL
jgi:2-polyprenyl-3-methyl-5-hydroxy-6-metoxy-1,4-benzoquinol methylase